MLELLQEERELTELEVEEQLERLHELNDRIAAAQKRRDTFQNHYREKMIRADEIFEQETEHLRAEIDSLTATLRRFAELNITGKKRSMKFPSGTLSFTKQQPQFFIGGVSVASDNAALLEFVKSNHAQFVRTKEFVDWDKLRKNLDFDGDNVTLADTGEIIPDMKVQQLPDKFTVKTTDSPLKKALDLETLHALNEEDEQDETTD